MFLQYKIIDIVEKSTQSERAREACEIAKIREIMVTKLQEKGRPVKKKDRNISIDWKREKRTHTVARIREDR
jgi:hypothetical protein